MRIDQLTQSAGAAAQSQAQPTQKEEFLKLLVAQLEHQNPLEPQSGAEFVAQLAQFTAVEQSEQTNDLLNNLHAEQVSASNAALAGFVGKTGSFETGDIQVADAKEGIPELGFELESGVKKGTAVILDQDGNEVRRVDLGPLGGGEHSFQWDGQDRLGQAVEPGNYRVEIRLENEDGTTHTAATRVSGLIEAIDFSKGFPMMRLGGALFAPGDVSSIS